MSKDDKNSVVVTGTIFWPFLVRKSNMSDKYQVDIGQLSKADAKKLSSIGINVKTENKEDPEFDRGLYVTCKSAKYPINKFTYKDKSEVSDKTIAVIGNGTKVKAVINSFETEFNKKVFVGANLKKAVILDLVEYVKANSEEDEELYAGLEDEEDFYDDEIPE